MHDGHDGMLAKTLLGGGEGGGRSCYSSSLTDTILSTVILYPIILSTVNS